MAALFTNVPSIVSPPPCHRSFQFSPPSKIIFGSESEHAFDLPSIHGTKPTLIPLPCAPVPVSQSTPSTNSLHSWVSNKNVRELLLPSAVICGKPAPETLANLVLT